MERLQFSVSMCVYGKDDPEWFRTAVESILNQTCPPDEVVLVVDGPVPEPLDAVIHVYEQSPVFKIVRLPENRGLGNALKVALDYSSYELIARMDSDDISVPTRFEQLQACFLKDGNVAVAGGDISEFVGEQENIVGYRRVPEENTLIYKYLKVRCPMNHVTVMYRKSAVEKAGGYLDLFCNEDYYLWIRMAEQGMTMANTGTVLVNVRVGSDMYQRRGGKKYFESELFLQKYMRKRKMISNVGFILNVSKRWIVQRLLPNTLRSWVYRSFARRGT